MGIILTLEQAKEVDKMVRRKEDLESIYDYLTSVTNTEEDEKNYSQGFRKGFRVCADFMEYLLNDFRERNEEERVR